MELTQVPKPQFSALAILSLVTAIILPPLGVIVAIVALIVVRRAKLRGTGLAITGLIIGALLTGALTFLALSALPLFQPGEAEDAAGSFTNTITHFGGMMICSDGDNGYGINKYEYGPWYRAYYSIPKVDLSVDASLKALAASRGYRSASNGTDLLEPGDATVRSSTEAGFTNQKDASRLSYAIITDGSFQLSCITNNVVSSWGSTRSTTSTEALIELYVGYPELSR